jgi:zinc transporter, ZIP family
VFDVLADLTIIQIGILASFLAGLATAIGALPVFFTRDISDRVQNSMLGFAAGVMLAATAFSLIVPAIEFGGGGTTGVLIAVAGVLAGAIFLDLVDRYSPHRHFIKGYEGGRNPGLAGVWLFVIAIAIHNFPEGLAVGLGFGTGDIGQGMILAIAIGLQNMPEGLAVAFALRRENYSPRTAFLVALLTGLIEPLGGILGLFAVQWIEPILPYGLAFAGGAMLFVISDEIIPETHRRGRERQATYALMIGFVIMMFLDTALG